MGFLRKEDIERMGNYLNGIPSEDYKKNRIKLCPKCENNLALFENYSTCSKCGSLFNYSKNYQKIVKILGII